MNKIKEDIYIFLLKLKDTREWNEYIQAMCWWHFADYLTNEQLKEIFGDLESKGE